MFFENRSNCGESKGCLPECGNLVFPYVPMQGNQPPVYDANEALNNGTLYPALNLPFHLKVGASDVVKTPLNELQALEFVIQELNLYLDTHPDDKEAFALFQKYVALEKTARENYEEVNGPLFRTAAAKNSTYTWLQDPWPWNAPAEGGN